jgi:hypothetical protein
MRTVAVVIALVAATSIAAADEGAVIYAKGTSLYRQPMGDGGARAVEIARLGFPAKQITRLTAKGKSLLISAGEVHRWVRPNTASARSPRRAVEVCRGRATLSGDGRCVLCQTAAGAITITRLYPEKVSRPVKVPGKLATLLGEGVTHVVTVTRRGVESFAIGNRKRRRLLAAQQPVDDLLVSPDGKRAVATLIDNPKGDGEPTRSVYQFLLDGTGVKRKLVVDSRAVRWSRDSSWVVAAGDDNTCIARARGGQYRCWQGWRAVAMRPDNTEALLVRGPAHRLELARVSLAGARPAKPKPFFHRAAGDALWVP